MSSDELTVKLTNSIIAEYSFNHNHPLFNPCSVYRLLHYCFRYLYKEDKNKRHDHVEITKHIIQRLMTSYPDFIHEKEHIDYILANSIYSLHSIFIYDIEEYVHKEAVIKLKEVINEIINKISQNSI